MKVLLTTLNAKFIHSSLALRYLRAICQPQFDVVMEEFTINDRTEAVVGEIFRHRPDVVAFSCYIWNIEPILAIAAVLKQVLPQLVVVAGGPEVSFAPEEWLREHPSLDFIVAGEGEEAFPRLLDALAAGRQPDIPGVAYRKPDGLVIPAAYQVIERLGEAPTPYGTDLQSLAGKLVYYESSRGCPFRCRYCLSSATTGVRFFPMDRVKSDLMRLIDAGVRQVNFVDRTFNCHPKRAMDIFRFLAENRGSTVFHFEICADLIDEDMLAFLLRVPKGLFRLEIGVQSTNPGTLDQIQRKMNWPEVRQVVRRLTGAGNIHVHVDLIAGLPEEDYPSFARSFDDVYYLCPDEIQMGFLKLLRGSSLREATAQFGLLYYHQPPYEVLQTNWMGYPDLLRLKLIEDLVERYFNSAWFNASLRYLEQQFPGPFAMFEAFALFWEQKQWHRQSPDREEMYRRLAEFWACGKQGNPWLQCEPESQDTPPDLVFLEILKFDYLLHTRAPVLPAFFPAIDPEANRQAGYRFLADPANVARHLPELSNLSPKQIGKLAHWETFACDISGFVKGQTEVDTSRPVTIFFYYPVGSRHLPAMFFAIPGGEALAPAVEA